MKDYIKLTIEKATKNLKRFIKKTLQDFLDEIKIVNDSNKTPLQIIWNGLSKEEQVLCLQQAKERKCDAPQDLPECVWKSVTHYFKNEKIAWVAHIEGGECEDIKITYIGEALLLIMTHKSTKKGSK